jgi:hypothetical protein
MKTLNDYIKESILDDEDVLIRNVKKDSKNPFTLLDILLNQHSENLSAIPEKMINEIVELLKLPKTMKIEPRCSKLTYWRDPYISLYDKYSRIIASIMINKDYFVVDIGFYGKSHEDLFGGKKEWETYIKDVLVKEFDLKIPDKRYIYLLNYKRK